MADAWRIIDTARLQKYRQSRIWPKPGESQSEGQCRVHLELGGIPLVPRDLSKLLLLCHGQHYLLYDF